MLMMCALLAPPPSCLPACFTASHPHSRPLSQRHRSHPLCQLQPILVKPNLASLETGPQLVSPDLGLEQLQLLRNHLPGRVVVLTAPLAQLRRLDFGVGGVVTIIANTLVDRKACSGGGGGRGGATRQS